MDFVRRVSHADLRVREMHTKIHIVTHSFKPEYRAPDHSSTSTAVIVHWGDVGPTVDRALEYLDWRIFSQIVIVANDGKDCPIQIRVEGVSWLVPPRNLGFAGGCSYGAMYHPADKYAFFNNDVILSPPSVMKCLEALDFQGVGISAPTLFLPDGSLQSGCGTLSPWIRRPKNDSLPQRTMSDCDWVTGAALFCAHEVLTDVGYDGSYFFLGEDVDLCIRAKKKGWRVVVLADAKGIHHPSSERNVGKSRGAYHGSRNLIWLTRRNQGKVRSIGVRLFLIKQLPRTVIGDLVRHRYPHAPLVIHGIRDGWSVLPVDHQPLEDEPIPSRWTEWV